MRPYRAWRQTYADETKSAAYEEEWMEQFLAWLMRKQDLGDFVGELAAEFALDHAMSANEEDKLQRELQELMERE